MNPATADWVNFFVAEVGAAAALAGFIIVAVSINLARILSFPQLPARAAESLVMLIGAMMLASLGLIPGQSVALFGAEALAAGAVYLAVMIYNQLQSAAPVEGLTMLKKFLRVLVNAAVVAPLVIGGYLLLLGSNDGLHWVAIGILISLAAGVWNAWVLLVEIMR